MKKSITLGALVKSLNASAIGAFLVMAHAAPVTPPPLPIGSTMVKQHAGMNQEEVKRNHRAHHHNKHHKKNYMRDDTLDGVSQEQDDSEPGRRTDRNQNAPKTK